MKIINIDDNQIKSLLKITDLENAFDVYVDNNFNNMFNLNKSIYINAEKGSLPVFQCKHSMHWTLISYKIYGTTRLAWLLWKVNNVKLEDTMKPQPPGSIIWYLPKNLVNGIVSEMTGFNK